MSNTPELKSKEKELVEKFMQYSYYDAHDLTTRTQRKKSNVESAIECALICIDEKITFLNKVADYWDLKNGEWYKDELSEIEQVKNEINKP